MAPQQGAPTVILQPRKVITMLGFDAEAVAIGGGRILDVGRSDDLRQRWPEAVVDRVDGVVLPGFHDAHMHFLGAVNDEHAIDAGPEATPTVAALLEQIRLRAAEAAPGERLLATRYDDSSVPDADRLDRLALDQVAPEHPAFVFHVAGHWGVANSRALEQVGYLADGVEVPGGVIARDAAGRPTGYLYENAVADFERLQLDEEAWRRSAGVVSRRFNQAGLTSVGDAWVEGPMVDLLAGADAAGDLTLRVSMLIVATEFDPVRHRGRLSDRLSFGGAKWCVDGAIGGRTALLDEPYLVPEGEGIEIVPPAESRELIRWVHAYGGRVAVHANGDRAIRSLIDSFEAVAREAGALRRPRIEHCSIVDDGILERMRALGAIAVPFASYARMYGGKLQEWYGEERVERMFAVRTFLDRGIPVAASTDHPMAPFEPLYAIQSMVTRAGKEDGFLVGPSQRVSVEEALRIYTQGSAFAEEGERERGVVSPGYLADLVVLGSDPREVPGTELATIPILATFVGGEAVWSAAGVDLAASSLRA